MPKGKKNVKPIKRRKGRPTNGQKIMSDLRDLKKKRIAEATKEIAVIAKKYELTEIELSDMVIDIAAESAQ